MSDLVDSVEEIESAMDDPGSFFDHLLEQAVGPAAIKLAVRMGRHRIVSRQRTT